MPGLQALPVPRVSVWKITRPISILSKALSSIKDSGKQKGTPIMKKLPSLALAFALCLPALLALSACGAEAEPVELYVFAAASMTETLDQIIEDYPAHPDSGGGGL